MGKTHDAISPQLAQFIAKQPFFFVATAPHKGHVNVSPRSPGNSCVVTSPKTVSFIDLTGSGCETAAHVLENGRMTLLFVNIQDGPPKMLRLHGIAKISLDADLSIFPKSLSKSKGFRCVYELSVERISTSCGYSMPIMNFVKYRTILEEHNETDDMEAYRTKKNCFSIDGLPSVMLMKLPPNVGPDKVDGYIYSKKLPWYSLRERYRARQRKIKLTSSHLQSSSSFPYLFILLFAAIFCLLEYKS